jgi:hypothetical protein
MVVVVVLCFAWPTLQQFEANIAAIFEILKDQHININTLPSNISP